MVLQENYFVKVNYFNKSEKLVLGGVWVVWVFFVDVSQYIRCSVNDYSTFLSLSLQTKYPENKHSEGVQSFSSHTHRAAAILNKQCLYIKLYPKSYALMLTVLSCIKTQRNKACLLTYILRAHILYTISVPRA